MTLWGIRKVQNEGVSGNLRRSQEYGPRRGCNGAPIFAIYNMQYVRSATVPFANIFYFPGQNLHNRGNYGRKKNTEGNKASENPLLVCKLDK